MKNPDISRIKEKRPEPETAVTPEKEPDVWDDPFETVFPGQEPLFEAVPVRPKKSGKEDIDEDEIFRRLAAEDLAAEAEERAREASGTTEPSVVAESSVVTDPSEATEPSEAAEPSEATEPSEIISERIKEAENTSEAETVSEFPHSREEAAVSAPERNPDEAVISAPESNRDEAVISEPVKTADAGGITDVEDTEDAADATGAEETADTTDTEETADTTDTEKTTGIASAVDVPAADVEAETADIAIAMDIPAAGVGAETADIAAAVDLPAAGVEEETADIAIAVDIPAVGVEADAADIAAAVDIPAAGLEATDAADKDDKPSFVKAFAGPSKWKKPLTIAAAALAGLLLLSSGIFLASHRGRDTFFARTYLANQDISGKTPEDVAREIIEKRRETMIVLTEKGTTTTSGLAEEFGYSLDEEALLAALTEAQDAQRHSTSAAFSSLVQSSDIPLKEVWTCDTETLYRKISSRNLNIKRIPSRDAALVYNENANRYVVTPEEYGNQFKPSDMQAWAKNALDTWFAEASSEDLVCRLEVPDSIYWKPSVLQDSPALHRKADALNIYADSKIVYTFGSQEVPLDFSIFRDWLSYENGFLFWDTDSMKSYIENMASVYDTRGIARDFTTTNGETVHFSSYYVDYGYRINQESELSQMKKDLMSKTTVTREPVYYLYDKWDNVTFYQRDGVDDLAGTYIEVSLSDQYVWFYKDGELIVETDCVTGNVDKEMETTPGMYAIAAKASPAVLRGGEGDGAYETPVNFWMPFNGGQGLHDATWRYYFGGNIYKTHGSHGCVNLPYDAAKTIYENCKRGMAVIVY